jgi:hypothetical protein
MAAQYPPDPLVDRLIAPQRGLGELGRDPGWAEPGMAEGEGDHPLLDQHAGLFAIRGVRRSLGRRISGPCRSSCRFQR